MNEGSTALFVVVAIAGSAALVVAAAWHIWYAMGLSRVFAQLDTDPWRAWVPFMNDAEVMRLGRVDPVKVALFLVPVVNLYALFLKGLAARRLDAAAGRGVGSTVLAVLLPPVWAMIAAQTRAPVAAPAAREPEPLPGVAFPTPPAALAMGSVPGSRPAPGGVIEAPAGPGVAPAAVPAGAPAAVAPAAPFPAPPLPVPAADAAPAPVAAATPSAPVSAAGATAAAPVGAGAARPESGHDEPAPLTRRARRGGDDATAVVRPPAEWQLVLPSGEVTAVTGRTIVLGRNPNPTEPGVQYVAVSDEGRTVSKHHARLEWDGQVWTITDLGSTNGVAVVAADGAEQTLPAEGAASVIERFVLGDAVVVLRPASA
ncbi:MAG: hypothetical protein K0Q58_700 [Microbacterium sp.]|nr:hypothetical protein [Microbacterium sp.]